MKRKAAHGLRRVARMLMRWSTRLEPPATVDYNISVNSAVQAGYDLAQRMSTYEAMRYQ